MSRVLPRWFVIVGVLGLSVSALSAQAPVPQPAPVFSMLPQTTLFPPGSALPDHPHDATGTLEDRNGPLLIGNPLLDGTPPNLGWFATTEVDVLNVQVRSGLRDFVHRPGGATDLVTLPYAGPNWTAAPRVELGYRFGQATGELVATYRFVTSSGSDTTPGFDAAGNAGALRSQMNFHVLDLDYASKENALLPWFDMKWRVGVRTASIFFQSTDASPLLDRRVANSFCGAGPHAALDLNRPLFDSRLGMFLRVDTAWVLGNVAQSFQETVAGVSAADYKHEWSSATALMLQAGLSWTPTPCWRFTGGYLYEQWWDIGFAGQISQPPTFSRAELSMQGIFLRGEWKF